MDLARIDESLGQSESLAGTVMLDQSSVGRLPRMDALQQQAAAQEMRERLSLRKRKLEAALDRIGASTFGSCWKCSGEIEMDAFMPILARFSVPGAQRAAKKEGAP